MPKNRSTSTANWDGYTAFWEIREDHLYLQQLEVCVYDEKSHKGSTLIFRPDTLKKIFTSYYDKGEICAKWYNGKLRVGKGKFVRYVHMGFDRNLEIEQVMTLKQGKILQSNLYHNHITTGLKLANAREEICKRFPWYQFPKYKGKRLTLFIKNIQIMSDGQLDDFDICSIVLHPDGEDIKDTNPSLQKTIKETLKAIHPWETIYINGQYIMEFTNYTIDITEDYLNKRNSGNFNEAVFPSTNTEKDTTSFIKPLHQQNYNTTTRKQ